MASRGDKGNGNGEEQIVEVAKSVWPTLLTFIYNKDCIIHEIDGSRLWRRFSAASFAWKSWLMLTYVPIARSYAVILAYVGG